MTRFRAIAVALGTCALALCALASGCGPPLPGGAPRLAAPDGAAASAEAESATATADASRAAEAEARMEAAAKLLKAGSPKDAAHEAALAVELAPRSSDARFLLGVADFELDDHRSARTDLETALDIEPKHAGALEYLGRVEYAENRLEQAIARWEAALAAEPDRPGVKALLEKARRESKVEGAFREEFTQHFRISLEGSGGEEGIAQRVGAVLESAYSDLGIQLGQYPERTIPVILYADREFYAVTGTHGWVGGLFDGKIRLPVKDAFKSDASQMDHLIRHEYTHACVFTLAPRCPTWLQEGLAQHFEGLHPDESRVAAAIRDGSLPRFASLANDLVAMKDAERVRTIYAASLAFIDFLIARRGAGEVATVLRALGAGSTLDAALDRTYGVGLSGLEEEWRSAVAPGGG